MQAVQIDVKNKFLKLSNFRGIKFAEFRLDPKITLVAGPTGSGKSSVINALQALVTGSPLPVQGLKKKDALQLVHESCVVGGSNDKSIATLTTAEGQFEIQWPSCKSKGNAPKCSAYAAGIAQPVSIPPETLTQILGISPTREDFEKEMEGLAEFNPPLEAIWESIVRAGWNETHTRTVEKGRELKREWLRLTGQEFGSVQSRKWSPEHYSDKSDEELASALASAEKIYEYAIKSKTLDEKERQDLEDLASVADSAQDAIKTISAELTAVAEELSKAQSLLDVIPKAVNPAQAYECWNCHKFGTVVKGKLVEAQDPATAQADAEAARTRTEEQQKIVSSLVRKRDDLSARLVIARADHEKCKEAQRKLNTAPADEAASVSPEDARAEVELCRQRIGAVLQRAEADEIFNALSVNQYLCAVLSAEGLRKQVLGARLAAFNTLLAETCAVAEWPAVSLDEYLDQRFGSRPYPVLSEGQKKAVNIILQLAIAKLDGSELLIIDGIEGLDRQYRNGLIALLEHAAVPAVLGCVFTNKAEVPALGDLGSAFWCQDGQVYPLSNVEE